MKPIVKMIAISAGIFVVATAANVAAKSIYTNSKIGLDKKALAISLGVGIAAGYLAMKYYKSA
jgi:hypothetical protein